jgi:hypothetical protein
MTQIEPKYVTFEQAKWLKEIGFNTLVSGLFFDGEFKDISPKKACNTDFASTRYYSAPEQHQVVEWLRVNHGIWTTPIPRGSSWIFSVVEVKTSNHHSLIDIDFYGSNSYLISKGVPTIMLSPQEAYSAAFDYILNNNLVHS